MPCQPRLSGRRRRSRDLPAALGDVAEIEHALPIAEADIDFLQGDNIKTIQWFAKGNGPSGSVRISGPKPDDRLASMVTILFAERTEQIGTRSKYRAAPKSARNHNSPVHICKTFGCFPIPTPRVGQDHLRAKRLSQAGSVGHARLCPLALLQDHQAFALKNGPRCFAILRQISRLWKNPFQ